jgi:DDE superfamily endonuclease
VDPGALAHAQKGADEEGTTIVWGDESGCYLLPLAVRSQSARGRHEAPRGATAILRVPLTRDPLAASSASSASSASTVDGRLVLPVRQQNYTGEAVVDFRRVLLRKISANLLVSWDGSPIHHNQAVKDFLAAGAAKRRQLERLPGSAPDLTPDLTPDEGMWNSLKRVALGNVCCADLADRRHRLLRAAVRVRHQPAIIRACSRQCGYSVEFPVPKSVEHANV